MHNQGCAIFLITALIVCVGVTLPTKTFSDQTATYGQEATSSSAKIEWDTTFGLGYYNIAHQIIQAKDGDYVVAGMYGRSNPLNATIAKYNANGKLQWYRSYELQFMNYPMNTALLQTNDSGYAIVGNKYQTLALTLIKTDPNGTIQWSQTYPGSYLALGMAQTSDGGYLITAFTSTLSTETHRKEALIKTDASGKMQWSKTFETGHFKVAVQANDGNYVVAGGNRIVKVDTSGNILWDKELPPVLPNDPQQYRYSANDIYSLTKTTDRGYALAGHAFNKNNSNQETSAAVLIKTDSAGAIQWNKTYGADRQTWIFSIVQTSDNGYALAGMAHTVPNSTLNEFSQTDMMLIKTDANGNEQWIQTFGGSQETDIAFSVIESTDGGFALAGQNKPGTRYNESYYYIVRTTHFSSTDSPTTNSPPIENPALSIEILAAIIAILVAAIIMVILALIKVNQLNLFCGAPSAYLVNVTEGIAGDISSLPTVRYLSSFI